MPYLRIETNSPAAREVGEVALQAISTSLADLLGKPESYVEVAVVPVEEMMFGGSSAPCAFVELKSLGLQADQAPALSEMIAALLAKHFSVPADRAYIQMSDHPRELWGWNSKTFR